MLALSLSDRFSCSAIFVFVFVNENHTAVLAACAATKNRNERFHFTTRRYASAVYAVIVCSSVCLSVCLSQVGVLQRWLNVESHKPRDSSFLVPKILAKFQRDHPQQLPNRGGVGSNRRFSTSRYISETVQDRDIVTMEG